jgi:glycosyltransferase involved in cell wall biosynthesis
MIMRTTPLDLTIAIPVRNEERNLPACLAAIGPDFARRVVVLDSGSTDRTREIAAEHGAEVFAFEWNGRFPKKRNWFLREHRPDTAWVMFLDADEFLTPESKAELLRVLPGTQHTGFWLAYSIYFLGRKLKGGYPLNKLALFRVGAGEYERIEEERWSHLDMEIHEHPVLSGSVGRIRARIDHQDLRGTDHYVWKHSEYASWEAARFLRTAAEPAERDQWTWKQRVKYGLMETPFLGPIYFVGSFVLMGGFRDGFTGLAFAILKMGYFTQVYCRLREAGEKATGVGSGSRFPGWRLILALVWLAAVGGLLLYLLMRTNPSASDLPLPRSLISWLNWAHDLRTLPMAWCYAAVPAFLLAGANVPRRLVLSLALLVLVGGEMVQAWIPSRSFTLADLAYSILGVVLAEWMAVRWQSRRREQKAVMGEVGGEETKGEPHG